MTNYSEPALASTAAVARRVLGKACSQRVIDLATELFESVPPTKRTDLKQSVGRGVREGIQGLSIIPKDDDDSTLRSLIRIAAWVPADERVTNLPPHHLCALRLTADYLACSVRSKLDDLYARFIPDTTMAQFNLRVRQVILDELLLHPAEASRLSYFASSVLTKKAQAMESTYLGSQGDGC